MKNLNIRQTRLTSLILLACPTALWADENFFGYNYMTDIAPKGAWELEQWVTPRIGKESGTFVSTDFRTEIETGITKRLQGSLYLNYNHSYIRNARGSSERIPNRNRFGISGTSVELKYKVLSPFDDSFGMALYLEPGYGTIEAANGERHQEIELEGKLILEKRWLENKLVGVFNYTLEPEWAKGAEDSGFNVALKMEWSTGLAYEVARHWHLGLETRVQTEFEEADLDKSAFVVAFVGPAVHYEGRSWWATLSVMPQVWGWPDKQGTGGLHLDDHERLEVRLKVGYEF